MAGSAEEELTPEEYAEQFNGSAERALSGFRASDGLPDVPSQAVEEFAEREFRELRSRITGLEDALQGHVKGTKVVLVAFGFALVVLSFVVFS